MGPFFPVRSPSLAVANTFDESNHFVGPDPVGGRTPDEQPGDIQPVEQTLKILEPLACGQPVTFEIEDLDRLAGSDGLRFWPFLAPSGAAGLAPGTRGRLSGLQLSHGPTQVARAVVEGLAFELKRHLLFFQRAGIPVEKLVTGGTAAASQVTPQLLADVTELPLACLSAGAGSLLGACIVARGLQEPQRSLADLADEMLPPARQVQPGPNAAFYAEPFAEYLHSLPLE